LLGLVLLHRLLALGVGHPRHFGRDVSHSGFLKGGLLRLFKRLLGGFEALLSLRCLLLHQVVRFLGKVVLLLERLLLAHTRLFKFALKLAHLFGQPLLLFACPLLGLRRLQVLLRNSLDFLALALQILPILLCVRVQEKRRVAEQEDCGGQYGQGQSTRLSATDFEWENGLRLEAAKVRPGIFPHRLVEWVCSVRALHRGCEPIFEARTSVDAHRERIGGDLHKQPDERAKQCRAPNDGDEPRPFGIENVQPVEYRPGGSERAAEARAHRQSAPRADEANPPCKPFKPGRKVVHLRSSPFGF